MEPPDRTTGKAEADLGAALARASGIGCLAVGSDGLIRYANPAACSLLGRDRPVGAAVAEVLGDRSAARLARRVEAAVTTGAPSTSEEEIDLRGRPSRRLRIEVSPAPGWAAVLLLEASRAGLDRDRLLLLIRFGEALQAARDRGEAARTLARLVVPALADWCYVDLMRGGRLDVVVVRHRDPALAAAAEALQGHLQGGLVDESVLLRPGRPVLHAELDEQTLADGVPDARLRGLLAGLGLGSIITVPIASRERLYGTLVLGSMGGGRAFASQDLELAAEIARKEASALENSELVDAVDSMNRDLEARVEQRTAELRQANADLESFSYSVSHDLQAPLRAIDGYAGILLEEHTERLNDDGRRLLGVIRRNVSRMRALISDLMALARAGRVPLSARPVDMKALVSDAYAQLAGSETACFVCGDLPNAWGDESLLRQVVVNLLSNALKFTARIPAPRIEVEGRISGGSSVYSVRDNGVGFDMKLRDRLFGVFQRLHSAAEFEGTGLGLALTARIVRRHGGSVWGEGEPGRGAAFHFALPLPAREEAACPPQQS